jgi:hypothetical protein
MGDQRTPQDRTRAAISIHQWQSEVIKSSVAISAPLKAALE